MKILIRIAPFVHAGAYFLLAVESTLAGHAVAAIAHAVIAAWEAYRAWKRD